MKQHRYRITVEHLASVDGAPLSPPLCFEAASHDEILGLVQRAGQRAGFVGDAAAAFTVGLKLLGEVMLRHRDNPLFEEFRSHFGQFMKRLKKGPAAEPPPASGAVPAGRPDGVLARCGGAVERFFDTLRCS